MQDHEHDPSQGTIDMIMTTRAMRRYSDRPVADADIETCLRAAQQGPSGGNVQPQQYVVVLSLIHI